MSDQTNPENAMELLKPTPKPGDVIGKKMLCPKHGDITGSALSISLGKTVEGKTTQSQYLYCVECLNDVLLTFQKNKAIEVVTVQDVIYQPNENDEE